MRVASLAFALVVSSAVGCAHAPDERDSSGPLDESGADGGDDTAVPMTEAELLAAITGEWHGAIGPGYKFGCLCLTLDEEGDVVHPSGITLGASVKGGGVTIVSLEDRAIDIATTVEGSAFHIEDATVSVDASLIEGSWMGEGVSDFDEAITLDRDPASCEDRTGLWGAPC